MDKKIFAVVGAGPGIGNHVTERFGREGYHVVLLSRNQDKLDTYSSEFMEKNISVSTYAVDAYDESSLADTFERIKKETKKIDVLFYNVAVLQPSKADTLSSNELMKTFQIDVASALFSARQVLPEQIAQGEGVILFTGGGFSLYPSGEYTTVSVNKAALRNLTFALAENLKDKGIFVGMVTIVGNVEPDTHFSPELIAEKFWELATIQKSNEIIYR